MDLDEATLPRPFRVVSRSYATHDVVTLGLEPADDGDLIDCAPGQFNMLYSFGVGEAPISVSSSPSEPVLSHTIRAVGAVTRSLCATLPGHVIGVRGPFGRQWPLYEASGGDLLIIAGGIGLAPLRPVILDALNTKKRYGNIIILYGARTPADLLFIDEHQAWREQADQVLTTVDAAGEDWAGDVGVVTSLLRRARFDPPDTTALICGPEIMMKFIARDLIESHVPSSHLFISMERSFSCAMGLCGKCQIGPEFVCKDGPVFRYPEVSELLAIPEL